MEKKIEILNINAEKTGNSCSVPKELTQFSPHQHSVYLTVKQFLAHQRSGTHKVKDRAEVKGASRKLHKQKGTGGSRKGNIRNPLYKGGGSIFGPKPHKYHLKVNKKQKDLALNSVLIDKINNDKVIIVDQFFLESPKTKQMQDFLNKALIFNKKNLLIIDEWNENLWLSSRNLPKIDLVTINELNTYQVINADLLIFTESSFNEIVNPLSEPISEENNSN